MDYSELAEFQQREKRSKHKQISQKTISDLLNDEVNLDRNDVLVGFHGSFEDAIKAFAKRDAERKK